MNRQASHAASHKQTSPRVLEFQLGTLRIEDRLGVRFRATSTKEKASLPIGSRTTCRAPD